MNRDSENKNEIFNVRILLNKIIHYWYLFLISFIVFFGLGILYLRYAAPTYEVSSLLTLSGSGRSRSNAPSYAEGLEISNRLSDLRNEVLTLSSYPLIEQVIKNLGFEISYYYKEDFVPFQKPFFKNFPHLILKEMYKSVPFEVIINKDHIQPVGVIFYINIIDNKEFYLTAHARDVTLYNYKTEKIEGIVDWLDLDGKYKFGEEISGPDYSFKILLNSSFKSDYEGMDLYFAFNGIHSLAMQYKKALDIGTPSYEGRTISITFRGGNVQKSMDFVKGLEDEYMKKNLNKKYETAIATIQNIDRQIITISDSLNLTEKELKNFRRQHNVMNIQDKAQRVADQKQNLENQKREKTQQLKFYKELYQNFKENKNSTNLITPASMGVNDPALNTMVEQLVANNIEKKALEDQNQTRTSHYHTLVKQIEELKTSIAQNIQFFITNTESSLNEINNQLSRINYDQNVLPQTQLQLRDIERKSSLNDELFTFLLRKRSEAQIAKAALKPDIEIIEPPYYLGISSPSVIKTFVFSLFFALGFPGAFLFLVFFFDNKIHSVRDIKEISEAPILGQVLHNTKKSNNAIKYYPLSPVAESIRSLRTNIFNFKKGEQHQVILITSMDSNEGKSFIALNLASGMAALKKKTVLLGFDLRKPNDLMKLQQEEQENGIASFLEGKITNIQELILSTNFPYLDFIPAGTLFSDNPGQNTSDFIPPNPTELIDSEQTETLFQQLKEKYDYIIIDTPPVGPVTDALILMRYSDINLFIVRQNVSDKNTLKNVLTEIDDHDSSNIGFVLNDLSPGKMYGYKKNYSYKYYGQIGKKNIFKKIFKV